MKSEYYFRCNNCQKAHNIVTSYPEKDQSIKFSCTCGNNISGQYSNKEWHVKNATPITEEIDEPVFIHEPILK